MFRKVISIGLATLMFVATTGVSIHQLLCPCEGVATTSLLPIRHSCDEKPAAPVKSCCAKKEKQPLAATKHKTCHSNKEGCCNHSVKYVALGSAYEMPVKTELSLKTFFLLPLPAFGEFVQYPSAGIASLPVTYRPPPYWTSGRDIILEKSAWLC